MYVGFGVFAVSRSRLLVYWIYGIDLLKRHTMPSLLPVARLSLTKRSVALRPRLAARLPLS
jgi:hypothetical protein